MKQLAFLLLSIFNGDMLHAQHVSSTEINKSLEIIIRNFSGKLSDFKGTLISKKGHTSRFHSNLVLPGLPPGVIIEEHAPGRSSTTWRTLLFSSADAEDVRLRYKEVFGYLNNSIIKPGAEKPFILSGKYMHPSGNAATVTGFQLLPSTTELKEIKLQLILEKQGTENILSLEVCREQ